MGDWVPGGEIPSKLFHGVWGDDHRACYPQHLGVVVLFICPYLMYAPLASLLSENCSSAAKGETENSAHWSLTQVCSLPCGIMAGPVPVDPVPSWGWWRGAAVGGLWCWWWMNAAL